MHSYTAVALAMCVNWMLHAWEAKLNYAWGRYKYVAVAIYGGHLMHACMWDQ